MVVVAVRPTLLQNGFTPQQCDDILREIFSLEQADVDDAATQPLSRSNSEKVRRVWATLSR
jgi:hypothetical protein